MPNRDLGEHVIDEMGGCIGHAPSATRRTEPPPFARKGDEPIVAAGIAVDTKESMGEDAAVEIGADFALDEAGDGRARRSGAAEEGLEFAPDDLMKEGLLGLVTFVSVDGWESIGTGRRQEGRSQSGPCEGIGARGELAGTWPSDSLYRGSPVWLRVGG